jgi:uncharacterized protein
MKNIALTFAILLGAVSGIAIAAPPPAMAQDMSNGANNFYTSDRVDFTKVTFKNKLGMKAVGNLFTGKSLQRNAQSPAIGRAGQALPHP